MQPRKTEKDGSGDLFRARLDQIINMRHELVRLAEAIDWDWLDGELGSVDIWGIPGSGEFVIQDCLLEGGSLGSRRFERCAVAACRTASARQAWRPWSLRREQPAVHGSGPVDGAHGRALARSA